MLGLGEKKQARLFGRFRSFDARAPFARNARPFSFRNCSSNSNQNFDTRAPHGAFFKFDALREHF